MSNEDKEVETIPVGPLGLVPLKNCEELGKKVDAYLAHWRDAQRSEYKDTFVFMGYEKDFFIVQSQINHFGTGEGKGALLQLVRGKDLLLMVDVRNHSLTYSLCGMTNHMSPDDYFTGLKRVVSAAAGKTRRINATMLFLYESRVSHRDGRESLDCLLALHELISMGVDNILTFDAHEPCVQNTIPLKGLETMQPIYQFIKTFLQIETELKVDSEHMMIISPDAGGMGRVIYFANMMGLDVGMFYKCRDYTCLVGGRNPTLVYEFLGAGVTGKDVIVVDDIVSPGETVQEVARELKHHGARKVFVCATFGLFANSLARFDRYYEEGMIDKIFTTNLVYQSPELLSRPYYVSVEMSKYIALLIDSLNRGTSASKLLQSSERIYRAFTKHRAAQERNQGGKGSMAEKKRVVKEIISMEQNFAQWYTDIVRKVELCDCMSVKGCMVIQPAGYTIWERIQSFPDQRFKVTDVKNCYMPPFTPESLLDREKDHVEGFAPEVAWVTQGDLEPLQERLCVCPTSETLFCDYYVKHVRSHCDSPQVLNQWCSVVRWERTTCPFLRSREFLWQEGHTVYATEEEAQVRTEQMLNPYANFCEQELAILVVRGQKTDKEKFAGTVATCTIESLMRNGKALQSGTSHNSGDGFARAFGMQSQDKDNSLKYMHQTSWGMTTRMIGALIMAHGDDSSLKMPPHTAPVQVTTAPVATHEEGVLERIKALVAEFRAAGVCVNVGGMDRRPGSKFAECEMRGVPLRIELGPKDIEAGSCVLVCRDNGEKSEAALQGTVVTASDMFETIQKAMFKRAKQYRDTHTYDVTMMEEFAETVKNHPGFVRMMWCGDQAREDKIKEEMGATSRCIPFAQEKFADRCIRCEKPAKRMVYWGAAY